MKSDSHQDFQQAHLGRLLDHALSRYDELVLYRMTQNVDVPLALHNLVVRAQMSAKFIPIARHLSRKGARLIDLALIAGMTKQAMSDLVNQCEAWGLVQRIPEPRDGRARRIVFTSTGLGWLLAFERAVAQTEAEFRQEVGTKAATIIFLGLESYAGDYTDLERMRDYHQIHTQRNPEC